MGLTQKYKQQQQQVRVLTNESNYIKGMYFTDVPLAEGYSRVLVNFDIDSLSGKLTPRKGLQSLGLIKPINSQSQIPWDWVTQPPNVLNTKTSTFVELPNKHAKFLQSIVNCHATVDVQGAGNTLASNPTLFVTTSPEEITEYAAQNTYQSESFTGLNINQNPSLYAWNTYPLFYGIQNAGIHGKKCTYTKFMWKNPGTFAFGDSYYTFVEKRVWDTPGPNGPAGTYHTDLETPYILCYTKLGRNTVPDDVPLFANRRDINDILLMNKYFVFKVTPQQLNPTEAASWGYNMLLNKPYDFVCEDTAVNTIMILGIITYDKAGENIVLTPRKNQEVTLKGYYRAPAEFHTDREMAQFYPTTKIEELETLAEINALVATDYKYGNWWYCKENEYYYLCEPVLNDGAATAVAQITVYGKTQPPATILLSATNSKAPDKIRVRWQKREMGASDWTTFHEEVKLLSEYRDGDNIRPFVATTSLEASEVLVRLIITDTEDVDDITKEEYTLATNTVGLSAVSDELANSLNLNPVKYELAKCTGMCEWENRLVLWGVPEAENTLFVSDVNNPGYFPYPNNVDVFTEPILSAYNYGNELLVLTATSLYRLTWNTDGVGWTHKLVQRNLHVSEADIPMSGVIKNMFYFKSGNYYYMMVPKTSSIQGETTIAPVSKPIEELLDNFHDEIYGLVRVMVDEDNLFNFTDQLVNYFSYIDNTKIVFNYVYDIAENEQEEYSPSINSQYLYVQLIYDTESRIWSIKIFEAPQMLCPSHIDAIQQDQFVGLTYEAVNVSNSQQSAYWQANIQYYKFQNNTDSGIAGYEDGELLTYSRKFKNYQYLDTGNREINTEMKKRFREFQFKIKNKTATNLGFYNAFLVDGSLRKDLQHYNPRLISDPTTGEQYIVVERTLNDAYMLFTPAYVTTRIERILVPERMLQDNGELTPTTLAEETDPDRWILDQSALPGRTLWKIRMPISGKGYTPRAILLSTNEAEYEILGNAWVYRTMHAR